MKIKNQKSKIKRKNMFHVSCFTFHDKRGFTLVEALVAITIVLISVVGPLTIISKTLSFARFAKDEVTAFYLAQDAIEFIRNTRDDNAIAGSPWLSGLSECADGGICSIDSAADEILSCGVSCAPLKLSASGIYGHTNGVDTTFVREISINEISGNREAIVDVTVEWSQGLFRRDFTIRNHIFNWQ